MNELQTRGGRILAVSVDPPEKAKLTAQEIGVDIPILCDIGRSVTKTYGLLHEGGGPDGSDIPIPTNILIDPSGRIVWKRSARRIQDRPDPASVLTQVRLLSRIKTR